ncbi:hypothetical protein L3i22_014010 [Actinoplanes sp. L3-i22]|nr:hypothetical protein L3i22_014010 [Actinoplanes sp. L3-i22]
MDGSWTYRVEHAFRIAGGDVAVLGELSGVIPHRGRSGEIRANGVVIQVAEVAVEFARVTGGGERIALVLRGVRLDQVPVGATIHPAGCGESRPGLPVREQNPT